MFISLIEMPLSSFFTYWNPMTSSKTQIKCQLIWESSKYLLTPIQLIISVFIGPSKLLSCPFSYTEWQTLFIPWSSQFRSHFSFQPFNSTTVSNHSTKSLKNQLLGVNSTKLYPLTSIYSHVPTPASLSPMKQCHLPNLTPVFSVAFLSSPGILPYFSLILLISSFPLSPSCHSTVHLFSLLFTFKNSVFQYFFLFQQHPHCSLLVFYLMSKCMEMLVDTHNLTLLLFILQFHALGFSLPLHYWDGAEVQTNGLHLCSIFFTVLRLSIPLSTCFWFWF